MRVEKDFEDFLRLLEEKKVKYCIFGAYAVAFYGRARTTKDIDILIKPSVENAKRIIASIKDFFNDDLGLKVEDFTETGKFVQLGYSPNRIDVVSGISGISFDAIWKNKVRGIYGSVTVNFIGLNELLKAKEIAQRPQDKMDLEYFKKIKELS